MQPVAYMGWVPTIDKIYDGILREYGERIVSEASKVATESGVIPATTKVIDNNRSPVLAITKFADEGKFDLIVVGTRGIGA